MHINAILKALTAGVGSAFKISHNTRVGRSENVGTSTPWQPKACGTYTRPILNIPEPLDLSRPHGLDF